MTIDPETLGSEVGASHTEGFYATANFLSRFRMTRDRRSEDFRIRGIYLVPGFIAAKHGLQILCSVTALGEVQWS